MVFVVNLIDGEKITVNGKYIHHEPEFNRLHFITTNGTEIFIPNERIKSVYVKENYCAGKL